MLLNNPLLTKRMFQNVLFYQFTPISDPQQLREEHKQLAEELGLLGKVLFSDEGVNGNVSGTKQATKQYMEFLEEQFPGMDFKVGNTPEHNFNKMVVKVRPEIITLKEDVDLSKKAPYIKPQELKELLDNNEDVILLDTRNAYEADFGTFKGAVVPDVNVFKDFPEFVKNNLSEHKDKTIVTFCTGGIRCEKATAWMAQEGFSNVKQLQGGILTYGKEVGGAHWSGECFVFDERLAVDMNNVEEVHPNRENTSCANPAYFKKELGVDN